MNIESLITDLALILILGAAVTILFKWLKQPVVLGYIVAGFLASPHFGYIPSVHTTENIEFWAQIGIVVLLFTLGLEFSFKKFVNVGGSAIVTALIIIIGMMATGFVAGYMMGMSSINSLFLGGMLSMSSTTIIIKAFNDMGIRHKKFTSLVLAVLIVEDLFAVLMMVILSSIALNNSVAGGEMLFSVSKLVFFIVIWFVVGTFLLPSIFNRVRHQLNGETLLVVSMGLCLGMAVFSVVCGFSLALGAFVMGSILAGTSYAERIEHVMNPVKDLFGAVFFISVGMMVQPEIIVEYWSPILILSLVVIFGMIIFGTFGMLVTGQNLKIAIQSGFSLTQIGEFAFIIATLGMSLGVLDETIYPIVVAVSVITTFTTPYFIKLSDPVYNFVEKKLPKRLHFLIDRYSDEAESESEKKALWKSVLKKYIWRVLLYSIILIAIALTSQKFFIPWLKEILPDWWRLVGCVVTLAAMLPFLIALATPSIKKSESNKLKKQKSRINAPVPVVILSLFQTLIAIDFVFYVFTVTYSMKVAALFSVFVFALIMLIFFKRIRKRLRRLENKFFDNLNERELRRSGKKNSLVSGIHLAYMTVGYDCPFVGERLKNSNLRQTYGVNIVSIQRGALTIPIPGGDNRIFPGDIIGIVGTDEQIQRILPDVERDEQKVTAPHGNFGLHNVELSETSPLVGKSLAGARIREDLAMLLVATQRDGEYTQPYGGYIFAAGDILWLVGEKAKVAALK
ncbi:MAG: cation:proton antiporter [Muribaculaceae bacterium]|nr:cation:proton antiporter [Muribaculaceae bacterium]